MEELKRILGKLPPPKNLDGVLSNPEDEYNCLRCRDMGFVYGRSYNEVVRCSCKKAEDDEEKNQRWLKLCELPDCNMTLANFKPVPGTEEALAAVKDLVAGKISWLTLSGDRDRGKTHLAIAACREWLARGKSARYAFVPLLLDELRDTFNPDAPMQFLRLFHFFCQVPLLVLDDLGAEKVTDFGEEKLESIVDYRYIHNTPLIVTTNKPLDELSPRIESRLKRHDQGKVVVMGGEQYRLIKRRSPESRFKGGKPSA